ncbi:MAG: cytochrome c1 [Rhodobacteraceae bacterium CG17_big_fil_post_rev_8_21_14_2_50_65_11]|nr:MAG: cytochrome c1 [Rhodobacteraceae bacterium CG17_big_fil_post_rev_8_21_14_2_50_65_11]
MFRKLALTALTAVALSGAPAFAAGEGHVENIRFSFDGPFGTFDQNQLQRGLQVFTEVCSACHGMRYVPIRSLSDPDGPGIPPDQVRAYIDQNFIEVWDADLRDYRTATPGDTFPANDAAGAPDLSMMAKARLGFHGPYGLALNNLVFGIGGPEYIASLLHGYTGEEVEQFGAVLYENTAFPSGLISMPPPLWEDAVEYNDGTPATVEQMAEDVAAYLMWAAEPNLMDRKRLGFTAVILLVILSTLLYLTNKRLWAPVRRAAKEQ